MRTPDKPNDYEISSYVLCEYRFELITNTRGDQTGRKPWKGSPGGYQDRGLYWIKPVLYEKGVGKWWHRREDLE